ncbi:MAG: UDP-N-acetylglucosamine 4,6-dehydratase (inverting) [Rhodospirillaceae bacterium]|jgi:UDP-N-acetylglucosamine 4,6-dehydratase|nr:UDP-N-acetylglucosamine 4,6-dehydratase (inverting) [Rhodospirillaceae bacterium]MDP6031739.1 UDP-N-acetylglucosamine 4,6-dehydratase (inverting) [Alphaproteobacteria bacterium]HJO88468.1 UDP-N-acetylglucosamine 4,6-dehydratase (inverting) [Alphaproteobacteria bacterium]|tara:strand:+ start:360 stop:1394 length:1035 start_codon:yes stop_codon:yes gene_type:complete
MSKAKTDFDTTQTDLSGKAILVTGGTGSFGRYFVKAVLERYRPKRLIVFSRDEVKQHDMAQDATPDDMKVLRFFIGDVRDCDRLEMAMREVDIVIHAAALKQIPAAEYNPFECIKTNVYGAENVMQAAIRTGVKQVVALSTDKAASPVNLYGASKLASDKIFVAANNLVGSVGTRFSVVRYGNVLGSRGSVVPVFQKLIAEGAKTLPITDPRMTRFWITLDQGVAFVLSCLPMMRGGEIFVPKIPSMKVVDMATVLAPDLPHEVVGIRPGEKLHEVMITEDDAVSTMELSDRFVIEPAIHLWNWESSATDGRKPVAEGFRYASNINDDWMDGETMCELIARMEQ